MYMNLKPNKHKRISFNTTTMASLKFIIFPSKIPGPYLNLAPPPPILIFCSGPPKIRGGGRLGATMMVLKNRVCLSFC